MDHLIGQRFNLISKSEIRYLGTLHEINPEDSTIALEDVYSFGTEDRKAASFIAPSSHKFDYIVFRGGDVKDIKVAEEQKENKQPSPQNVPNDPAILNSSRPGPPQSHGPPPPRDQSPFPPPGYGPPPPHFGGYYPPQQYGRGFGPAPPGGFGPGPGFQGMHGPGPYGPPPPGYFGPPGQGFPQGPNQFSPPPMGPPGQRPQQPNQQQHPPPPGPPPMQTPKPTSELPVDNRAQSKPLSNAATPAPPANVPTPPSDAKPPPSSEAPAPPQPTSTQSSDTTKAAVATITTKAPPSGPKSNRVTPAVPFAVNQKSFIPPVPASTDGPLSSTAGNAGVSKSIPSQAAMEAASRQAKEAVAAAMAKLNPQAASSAPKPAYTATAVEALTKKVGEMKTNENAPRGRGGFRGGRGSFQRNGSGGNPSRKIEIPKSDYDFESANAKFNKEDMIKEAIATSSPIGETPEDSMNGAEELESTTDGEKRQDSLSTAVDKAYDKKSSFFDNISSEAKDREDRTDGAIGGRPVRGEEYKKNLETFGQGNVDGGYGRGRGRGGFGRGRQYGGNSRGYNRGYAGRGGGFGNYRRRGEGTIETAQTST